MENPAPRAARRNSEWARERQRHRDSQEWSEVARGAAARVQHPRVAADQRDNVIDQLWWIRRTNSIVELGVVAVYANLLAAHRTTIAGAKAGDFWFTAIQLNPVTKPQIEFKPGRNRRPFGSCFVIRKLSNKLSAHNWAHFAGQHLACQVHERHVLTR